MRYAVSPAVMRQSDRMTVESGTSAIELLRRAGRAIFESHAWQGKVGIVCGTGNNGGDGYVLALCLREAGIPCEVIRWQDKASAEGQCYLKRVQAAGIPVRLWQGEALTGYRTIADGLFGTGFHGVAEVSAAALIRAVNESGAYVVAIDIPSGVSGLSGQAAGDCIRADATVVMGSLKYGDLLGAAKDLCGRITVYDIGIPLVGKTVRVPEMGDFASVLRRRKNDSHKGSYGYVTIFGGCSLYSGAAKLANLACTQVQAVSLADCGKTALPSGCGVNILIKSPSTEEDPNADYNWEQKHFDFIYKYMCKADEAITTLTDYEKYINVDSFIDWFLVHELSYNLDSCFRRSCYITKPKLNRLEMGPVWDFDLAFGNMYMDNPQYDDWATIGSMDDDSYIGVTWFNYLMTDESFRSRARARWDEVKDEMTQAAFDAIDSLKPKVMPSAEMNFTVWRTLGIANGFQPSRMASEDTYLAQIMYLRRFISARKTWIDENL